MAKQKLSKSQQELLDAMKKGVQVKYMSGSEDYYFRCDNFKKVTASVNALRDKGLVEKFGPPYKHEMRVKELGVAA